MQLIYLSDSEPSIFQLIRSCFLRKSEALFTLACNFSRSIFEIFKFKLNLIAKTKTNFAFYLKNGKKNVNDLQDQQWRQ